MTGTEKNNECLTVCSDCGGACCRTKPGIEGPERFLAKGELAETLAEFLASGLWLLDSHFGLPASEGQPGIPASELELFYPRPATLGEIDPSGNINEEKAKECVFLDPCGCRLIFAERPRMCRALEPSADFNCLSEWTRREAALAWHPWQESVEAARKMATSVKTSGP